MVTYNPPRYLFRRNTILKNLKEGDNFLEVGAGNLKLSHELTKFFNRGLALDFEPRVKDRLGELPENAQKKLSVKIGDFFNLKSSDEHFDCIVACEVMEHIKDDLKFISEIHKRLNEGGQVVISVPAKDKYWSVHDEVAGHFRRYHKKQLIDMFDRVGFKDIEVHSYGYPFVNWLRYLREAHGKKQAKTKLDWSKKKRTQDSGVGQISRKYDIAGYLVNEYTFMVPNMISSVFDKFDLSEAYVVTAIK